MADKWVGIVNEFAVATTKEVVDATVKGNPFMNKLVKAGRVTLNDSFGYQQNFPVKYKNPPVQGGDDSTVLQFSRRDCYKTGNRETRGHTATDKIGPKEYYMLKGGGQHVIVNRFKTAVPALVKAIKDTIATSLFIDGNASGNEYRFHGIPTMTGYTACAATDRIAVPNDTYLGLSTALAQGGTWSTDLGSSNYNNATLATDYPDGRGTGADLSFQYKYWSPLLVNSACTAWGTSSTDWKLNGPTIVRRTMLWLRLLNDNEPEDYYGVFGSVMFDELKEALEPKLRVMVPHSAGNDLGLPGAALQYEGLTITTDANCPGRKAYITNVMTTELRFLTEKMIVTRGPFQLQEDGWGMDAKSYGNAQYVPFQTAAIADYTS